MTNNMLIDNYILIMDDLQNKTKKKSNSWLVNQEKMNHNCTSVSKNIKYFLIAASYKCIFAAVL